MRVLWSTYGSRGDVGPLVGLAVRLRGLGARIRACAPPDEEFAQRPAGVGVPMVPVGPAAAEGCDRNIDALFGAALTHRASMGLPAVDGVRDYVIGARP